jgi:hypothetical protein
MTGKPISHYPALCRCTAFRRAERDPEQRDKILEKLGEGDMPSFSEKYNQLVPQGGRRRV